MMRAFVKKDSYDPREFVAQLFCIRSLGAPMMSRCLEQKSELFPNQARAAEGLRRPFMQDSLSVQPGGAGRLGEDCRQGPLLY